MRRSIIYFKQLTATEVGNKGTHEIYIRMPNDFNLEEFFPSGMVDNNGVSEKWFKAKNLTKGHEADDLINLRFAYFINSNHEKRIPSLGEIFEANNVQEGDVIRLEGVIKDGEESYFITFLKPDEIQVKPTSFYYSIIEDERCSITESKKDESLAPTIYYGAPGTGKTYRCQTEILNKYENDDKFLITFHQSYSYEEFVEGIRPVLQSGEGEGEGKGDVAYTLSKGIFYKACERAAELAGYANLSDCIDSSEADRNEKISKAIAEHKTAVICIDEINRANIAAVLGDLITLIEPSKRLGAGNLETIVTLPYSKNKFGVPANLKIVGTMNTADRSIQLLDSALRRRFKFVECLPDYEAIENERARNALKNINARIRSLLDKDRQIGHAKIMHCSNDKEILNMLTDSIIPQLEEYFYDDTDKIRYVLGEKVGEENSDGKECFYVEDEEAAKEYNNYQQEDEEKRKFCKLNDKLSKDKIEKLTEEECKPFIDRIINA